MFTLSYCGFLKDYILYQTRSAAYSFSGENSKNKGVFYDRFAADRFRVYSNQKRHGFSCFYAFSNQKCHDSNCFYAFSNQKRHCSSCFYAFSNQKRYGSSRGRVFPRRNEP